MEEVVYAKYEAQHTIQELRMSGSMCAVCSV